MLIGRDRAAWAMPSCAACGPSPVREPGQFSGLGRHADEGQDSIDASSVAVVRR